MSTLSILRFTLPKCRSWHIYVADVEVLRRTIVPMEMHSQPTPTQTFFSIRQLATRWSLSRGSVYKMLETEGIKTLHVGARRLIPITEVEAVERKIMSRAK